MAIVLDDIGKASYKRLKKDSDRLVVVKAAIKSKKQLVKALTEEWLFLEGEEMDDDADRVYKQKHQVELEVRGLELEEKALITKIGKVIDRTIDRSGKVIDRNKKG